MTATERRATTRTVTPPWENRRKRVGRDGTYPMSVTLRSGSLAETRTFHNPDDAQALYEQALEAGFEQIGDQR